LFIQDGAAQLQMLLIADSRSRCISHKSSCFEKLWRCLR